MVQKYVKALRTSLTSIGANMVMAAAAGIVMAYDRTLITVDIFQLLVCFHVYVYTSTNAMKLLKRKICNMIKTHPKVYTNMGVVMEDKRGKKKKVCVHELDSR